jgi:hypothetical protein
MQGRHLIDRDDGQIVAFLGCLIPSPKSLLPFGTHAP